MGAEIVAGVIVALVIAGRLFGKPRGEAGGQLTLTAEGVSYTGRGETRQVAWADLVEIGILNTSEGPFVEDRFWILRGASGAQCVVPATDGEPLLERVGGLPGFDHLQVIASAGCAEDRSFRCWTGAPGDAAVVALPRRTLPATIPDTLLHERRGA